jgi:hypothetical protein
LRPAFFFGHGKGSKETNIYAWYWKQADDQVLGFCLEEKYLIDTVLEDDYIAYMLQDATEKIVYLLFTPATKLTCSLPPSEDH